MVGSRSMGEEAKVLTVHNSSHRMRHLHPSIAEEPAFLAFLDELPAIFDTSGEVIFSARNEIRLFEIEGCGRVAVKSYRRPRWWQRWLYTFFRSPKAERAFLNAEEMERRRCTTPRVYAALSTHAKGLLDRSFLVTEYLPWSDLFTAFPDDKHYDNAVAEALGSYLAGLHEAGVMHHDLNIGNILYHKEGAAVHFSLIDINRMSFTEKPLSEKARITNLVRLTWHNAVFLQVAMAYAASCHYSASFVATLCAEKQRFEARWLRKKRFFKPFKQLFQR